MSSYDLSVVGKFVALSSCLDCREGWYSMELMIAVYLYGDQLLAPSEIQPTVSLTFLARLMKDALIVRGLE